MIEILIGLLGVVVGAIGQYFFNGILQSRQQVFDLGIRSDISNKILDKRFEFCEEYFKKLDEFLIDCVKDICKTDLEKYVVDFNNIKFKYYIIISPEIEKILDEFTCVIEDLCKKKIDYIHDGASYKELSKALVGLIGGEESSKKIIRLRFKKVLKMDKISYIIESCLDKSYDLSMKLL